jgi:DNA-binding transcriptional LysR family regulator
MPFLAKGNAVPLLFTDRYVDLVNEQVDLAVRLGPGLTEDVVATRLFPTRYRVVASPIYVDRSPSLAAPADLADHACTVFGLPSFRDAWLFRSAKDNEVKTVAIKPGITVHSALSLRSVVIGGGGPALLADWLISDDLRTGALVDLFPDYEVTATRFATAAYLIYPSRAYLPQKVRVAVDFLKQHLAR